MPYNTKLKLNSQVNIGDFNHLQMVRFMKKILIQLVLVVGFLSGFSPLWGNGTWNGTIWIGSTPGAGTGAEDFFVNAGTNCSIGAANMASLTINAVSGIKCTITGTVTSASVTINTTGTRTELIVNGTLNTANLTINGKLSGTGTLNLSAGSFSQTGILNVNSFNLLTGNITFSFPFSLQNLLISSNASAIISSRSDNFKPVIFGTLTINGTLTNHYSYIDIMDQQNSMEVVNLTINSNGSLINIDGAIKITGAFKVGGSISAASSITTYNFGFDNPSTSNTLEIFNNATVRFSDLTYSDATYMYLGILKASNNAKFTVDKDMTLNTKLTLVNGGTLQTSGTPTLTIATIDPIDGRLILPGATLVYTPSTLSLIGSNSAIAYLNKPAMKVILTGITDTIRNCNLQKITINVGAKGFITNGNANFINTIDASDSLKIAALPKVDSILVKATGKLKLLGSVRVDSIVDITSGGSLNSGGYLTMLDHSDLYFANEGQITGTINTHRKYGSAGWILFGSPFDGQTRQLTSSGGIAQQAVYMNKYVESGSNNRWVSLPTAENFARGVGYQVGITPITNDTLIFTGTPHIDNKDVTGLTFTTTNGSWFDYQRGYNLVGNPYTAPISISTFFSDNVGLNAIYFWDEAVAGMGKGQFITRSSTGIYTPDVSQLTAKNSSKIQATYLSPNQGFFVKVPSNNYTVSFKSNQITRDKNNTFLKSGEAKYVRLYVKNNSGAQNDCVIQFNDAASDIYNASFDVYKLISDGFPVDIYSYKASEAFAIQTRKPVTTDLKISIGLNIKKNENHTFSITNFDALPVDVSVFIKDSVTNRNVNLRDSSYTVSLKIGSINSRFKLIFTKGTGNSTGVESSNNLNDVKFISEYGKVYVDFAKEQQNLKIQVVDILGRIISEKFYNSVQGNILIDGNFEKNKIYIINLSGKEYQRVTKILVQ